MEEVQHLGAVFTANMSTHHHAQRVQGEQSLIGDQSWVRSRIQQVEAFSNCSILVVDQTGTAHAADTRRTCGSQPNMPTHRGRGRSLQNSAPRPRPPPGTSANNASCGGGCAPGTGKHRQPRHPTPPQRKKRKNHSTSRSAAHRFGARGHTRHTRALVRKARQEPFKSAGGCGYGCVVRWGRYRASLELLQWWPTRQASTGRSGRGVGATSSTGS